MCNLEYPYMKTRVSKEYKDIKLSDFPKRVAKYGSHAVNYFFNHGIGPRYVKQIEARMYPTERGICFTLLGSRLGFQERVFSGAKRFVYPSGMNMADVVFMPEPEHNGEELILVEGTTDAIAVGQAGLRSLSYLGTFLPQLRLDHIRKRIVNHNKVYIIPDNDAPGQHGMRQICKELPCTKVVLLPPGKKDVCSLSYAEQRVFFESLRGML